MASGGMHVLRAKPAICTPVCILISRQQGLGTMVEYLQDLHTKIATLCYLLRGASQYPC